MENLRADTLVLTAAERWIRRLLENHLAGRARFPADMGLTAMDYRRLAGRVHLAPGIRSGVQGDRDRLLLMLQSRRQEECRNLADFLAQYMRADAAPLNQLIATASMGFNHLWQDLGLASRGELRLLMTACFPELVAMNQDNMRWKKFFYRQLCVAQTGEISCRSPSCDSCCERESCFTPDD